MGYTEKVNEVDLGLRSMFKAAPNVIGAMNALITEASAEGQLGKKEKELMALAIAVAIRCDKCIVFHARAAARHGANRQEVIEALGVAIEMSGGPGAVYAGDALHAFDEFAGD